MLIGGIILGLVLGLWAGGRLTNLASIQLRWVGLLFWAVVIRLGTEVLLSAGVPVVEVFRVPLLTSGFVVLLAGLWVNRSYPGLGLAFVGILLNAVVIVVNGGYMPIWTTALTAAGFSADGVNSALHQLQEGTTTDFLVHLLILGDVIPIPVPFIRNVASLGDLFLSLGLGFFLFAGVVRVPSLLDEYEAAAIRDRLAGLAGSTRVRRSGASATAPETGLAPALSDAASLGRSFGIGSQGATITAPGLAPLPVGSPASEPDIGDGVAAFGSVGATATATATAASGGATTTLLPPFAIPRPSPEAVSRVRRHPYVRLALNGSFSALWAGQLISLFGDRIHQVALAAAILTTTGSVLASALVFVAATLPNLLLSPIAGTLVDRWDHKEVLIVSDLLRAAAVLLIPIAVVGNVVLVYPLVFLITTVSIFFRPARVAILPQVVRDDELLSANSALWVGETIADIAGWPLAGLFVISLGSALPVAFWLDSATYVASAALLSAIVVRTVDRRRRVDAAETTDRDDEGRAPAAGAPVPELTAEGFVGELKAGWHFLRHEPTLLANTLQATAAQLTVGVLIALTPAFALTVFGDDQLGWKAIYAFIETSQSVGSLIGGFLVGLVGTRLAKGQMIIGGYTTFGLLVTLFALSGNLGLVYGFAFGAGIANMVFLIPSQTLFQQRTPPELMGRVVGFRFALVFGAMTLAMAAGGLLAAAVGVTTVIAAAGLITMVAGLTGLFVPAVRDA